MVILSSALSRSYHTEEKSSKDNFCGILHSFLISFFFSRKLGKTENCGMFRLLGGEAHQSRMENSLEFMRRPLRTHVQKKVFDGNFFYFQIYNSTGLFISPRSNAPSNSSSDLPFTWSRSASVIVKLFLMYAIRTVIASQFTTLFSNIDKQHVTY